MNDGNSYSGIHAGYDWKIIWIFSNESLPHVNIISPQSQPHLVLCKRYEFLVSAVEIRCYIYLIFILQQWIYVIAYVYVLNFRWQKAESCLFSIELCDPHLPVAREFYAVVFC